MLDSFDHRVGEEPGDERLSLLGEGSKVGRSRNGEEEEEFQARPSSDESANSNLTSSPSLGESTAGHPPALVGEGQMKTYDSQCDFTDCGRRVQKRYDLNRHKKYHVKLFKCLKPSCAAHNLAFSLAKDLRRH